MMNLKRSFEIKSKIAVVRTGAANLASVTAALRRLRIDSRIVDAPEDLHGVDGVILPGVGTFATGMNTLRERGWDDFLLQRFANDEPTLAICLGLQLLCEGSTENSDVQGLGIMPVTAEKFPDNVSVPQFGWNSLESESSFFENGFVYYANSFCLNDIQVLLKNGWETATSEHGIRFVAAARKGRFLACQFHPELSGSLGQRLLSRWAQQIIGKSIDQDYSRTEGLPC